MNAKLLDRMFQVRGRTAQCQCGRREPSDEVCGDHFEFRGAGSDSAEKTCVCGYRLEAHSHTEGRVAARSVVEKGLCTGFRPRGPMPLDLYWCGCGNTD